MKLSRSDVAEIMQTVEKNAADSGKSYLDQFEIEVPDGLNTASVMEICNLIQGQSFERKVRLMRICIAGKNVKVRCPNGEVETFCLKNQDDGLEGLPLFQKEPAALIAIADAVQGYLLKKYLRPSKGKTAAETTKTSERERL